MFKYIKYARERCRPQLSQIDRDMISGLFVDLRRESLKTGTFPVNVGHLEAGIRLAGALCIAAFYTKRRITNLWPAAKVNRSYVSDERRGDGSNESRNLALYWSAENQCEEEFI
jgi:DNA replicative helicase MCM subunit Mcm2 (Cdc46/Mcm family)